ncbi:PREDICTED: fibropellin-1-like isoform X2 [Branchiostoma belcheri]|uniref:Fibropellin-1-like isoform X2 n=1 Tax=Branchiostoma belcheri TaxID=7741 RepID=A0A6P4ZAP9_BRABE|nr:PREDICTED: fibropellin-1-like isoform X2 [Branchiostoma belcheri]
MRVIIGLLLCLSLVLFVAPVGGRKVRKRCKPLTFPDTVRSCNQAPNAEGWYRDGTVCNFACRRGCVKDTGGTRRVCKVKGRSKWWTGGRGLKCNCRPCVGAPSHPEGYTSDCGAGTYPAGHTCVFTCPAGYVKVSGNERKLCVNGRWRGQDLVCKETDECSSNPCANGATCEDEVDGYTCSCVPGYGGDQCETGVSGPEECSPNPCANGGTCEDEVDGYACSCAPGYEGDHCETETDECSSNPCANGATCEDEVDGYTCTCAPGYEGDQCETETDECSSNPCANGATCEDEVGGYTCTCAPGYEGDHCETETDECSSNPCANGATCEDEVDGYTCTCAPGYEGDQCETEVTATTQATTTGEATTTQATTTVFPTIEPCNMTPDLFLFWTDLAV